MSLRRFFQCSGNAFPHLQKLIFALLCIRLGSIKSAASPSKEDFQFADGLFPQVPLGRGIAEQGRIFLLTTVAARSGGDTNDKGRLLSSHFFRNLSRVPDSLSHVPDSLSQMIPAA